MTHVTTVIIKTSTTCNLGCNYCYATDRSNNNLEKKFISEQTLEMLICKSINSSENRLEFIWHGGEPLLRGIDFYKNIIKLQQKYNENKLQIVNSLQTNATLISEEWAKFFIDYSIGPGVSLDGPRKIHNSSRRFSDNTGSFDKTMKGITLLQANNIFPNILAVVTKNSLRHAKEIFNFFLENHLYNFDFLPYAEFDKFGNPFPSTISAFEFGQFLIDIYNTWMQNNNPSIEIRFLHNALLGLLKGQVDLCTMSGACTDFFAIGTEGDIYHCDWFIGQNEDCFGNINHDSFEEIFNKTEYQNYISEIKKTKIECINCEWLSFCHGGCSHHRKITGGFTKPYYFCQSRKMLFRHMQTHLSNFDYLMPIQK